MDGVLQHILTAISKQHLFFRHTVDLTETYRDDTLLALIIDAGIETQGLGIKVLDGVNHFLAGLKVKLVSVEKIKWCIHCNYVILLLFIYFHKENTYQNPEDLTYAADDAYEDT